jgi:hypothetical protein
MDECKMMVVIYTDLHYTLTTPSLTGMPSLAQIVLANFVLNLDSVLSLICQRQNHITLMIV